MDPWDLDIGWSPAHRFTGDSALPAEAEPRYIGRAVAPVPGMPCLPGRCLNTTHQGVIYGNT